jgi:hypothetical protein
VAGEEDCCEAELVKWEEKCELGELEMGAGDKSDCRPELSVGVNWANKGEYWKDLRVVLGGCTRPVEGFKCDIEPVEGFKGDVFVYNKK